MIAFTVVTVNKQKSRLSEYLGGNHDCKQKDINF